ncbi:response regulator [Agromyces sp. SYSU T00266]|uniref:response regulator n=1 Tax=Agromyces zhanjiangensis TaxID=3158562 RepID=UPI00339B070C
MARTVLLVDDHGGFRRMARLLLERAGYVVAGEADSAADAVDSVRRLGPDLVLLDVLLPDGNGADVAETLARLPRPPGVVLTSSYPSGGLGDRLQNLPLLGFLQKDELSVERLRELFG